jgi:hypothetical protein
MKLKKQTPWLLALPLAVAAAGHGARADFPSAQPYPEVRYEHRSLAEPAQQIDVARIDLSDPDVDVRVSGGGPDPDGAEEYQTTLQVPTVIAEREHFEVAVNGDFFAARQTVDAEGAKSGFVTGKWAKVLGPAVTDGFLWAPAAEPRAALILDAAKKARIESLKDVPADARQVIAGSGVLLKDGQSVTETASSFSRTRHPRTAAGLTDDGKTLVLVVVDGRRPGKSVGMSLAELAALMLQLGCRDALNLDGGGSSEMVLRNPESGLLQVMNSPSDGRERAVGNVLGVTIRGARRVPKPAAPAGEAPQAK